MRDNIKLPEKTGFKKVTCMVVFERREKGMKVEKSWVGTINVAIT